MGKNLEKERRSSARKKQQIPSVASPGHRGVRILSTTLLILIGIVFLVPLLWIVLASVDYNATVSVKWPSQFTMEHFQEIWSWDTTFRPLWISLIVAGGTAILTVVVALLASYPLSRYKMKGNKAFMYTILFGTTLPITALMVPVYALFVTLNLLNNLGGMIVFLAATWVCCTFG